MNRTGKKFGGRKAGTPNKLTQSAKQAFTFAFEKLGGVDALAKWATEHQTEFYRIYARLLPADKLQDESDSPQFEAVSVVIHHADADGRKLKKYQGDAKPFHEVRN